MNQRRQHARSPLSRPCKVFHKATGRYWSAVTWDLSCGGTLLAVDAPRELKPGDEIDLFVAWSSRTLLSVRDCVAGEVRRVLMRTDGKQMVGVAFSGELTQGLGAITTSRAAA